jgi:hypothetical protein
MDTSPRRSVWRWLRAAILPVALVAALACRSTGPRLEPQMPPAVGDESLLGAVRLFREVVSFRLSDTRVEGQGFYYFRNAGTVAEAFPTAFAFLVSDAQGPPEHLRFMHVARDYDEEMSFVWLNEFCPLTQIVVQPKSRYCLRLDWQQRLTGTQFAYHLQRDPPWNADRRLLRLTLSVPDDFRHVRFNWPYSHRFKTETDTWYVFAQENVVLTEDLAISWER